MSIGEMAVAAAQRDTLKALQADNTRLRAALAESLKSGNEPSIDVDRWLVLLADRDRLRAALFEIQCQQLRIASATDMTRPAMREAAMETRNEIIAVLAVHGQGTAK